MNLMEMLAAKRQVQNMEEPTEKIAEMDALSDLVPLSTLVRSNKQETIETEEADIPASSHFTTQVYEEPDWQLFLAIHTPYLLHPYSFHAPTFRAYKEFLLGESLYVLNTFTLLDTDRLLRWYLLHIPPVTAIETVRLGHFLLELHLTVPAKYEQAIGEILEREARSQEKNA